jgi:hypothetical protein
MMENCNAMNRKMDVEHSPFLHARLSLVGFFADITGIRNARLLALPTELSQIADCSV